MMRYFFYLIAVLAVLALLYLFALLPRYGQRPLERLRRSRYAHRGLHNARQGIPENSILAFRYALAGHFGAEIDVHLTRDNRLVVIHDSDLQRLCGVEGTVEDMDFPQLRQLQLEGTKERIPLFEEVLTLFSEKAPLIIELKTHGNNYRELCKRVCKRLETYRGDYCIESFDPRVLWWLRRNEPFIIRGQLAENFLKRGGPVKWPLRFAMTFLLCNFLTRPDFIAYRYEDRGVISVRLCTQLLKAQEVSWTIRSQEDLDVVEGAGGIAIFESFLPEERKSAVPSEGQNPPADGDIPAP